MSWFGRHEEQLLNVRIPADVGKIFREHITNENALKLIIVAQVYTEPKAQENIETLCTMLANFGAVRLFAVEGTDQEIIPSERREVVDFIAHTANDISAGVLAFLSGNPTGVVVSGVDNPDLRDSSWNEMLILRQLIPTREHVFKHVRPILSRAQKRIYPHPFAQLRRDVLVEKQETLGPADQITLLQQLAKSFDINMEDYPLLLRYHRAKQLEHSTNFRRAEKERGIFAKRLHEGATSWYEAKNGGASINPKRAEIVLRYYAQQTGLTQAELDARSKSQADIFQILTECYNWIIGRLIEQGRQSLYGDGWAYMVEEMERIALGIDVPYFDLREFRKFVAMTREMDVLMGPGALSFTQQIMSCSERITIRLTSEAQQLYKFEQQLSILYRALKLELNAVEAESVDIVPNNLSTLLLGICELAGLSGSHELSKFELELTSTEEGLRHSRRFQEMSKQRGDHMIREVFRSLEVHHQDRAVLVVGGYHADAIIHRLEDDYPHVSWSLIMPTLGKSTASIREQ